MSDDIDYANNLMERERQTAISRRVRYTGISATECQDCGEEIPERRREALRGVQTCFDCAELAERRIA